MLPTRCSMVHVYSFIPKLSEEVSKLLPSVTLKVVPIKEDISQKYGKVVHKEELSMLQDAKILISDGELIAQIYDKLPNLEWIQCTWAGVEGLVASVAAKEMKPSYPITRFGVRSFSQLMSEYCVAMIINQERGLMQSYQKQLGSEWFHKDKIATYRSLQDLTVGVLGVGLIGKEVIKALKSFSCTVHSLGRSGTLPDGLQTDKHWPAIDLKKFLYGIDYIVNVLPSTPETKNFLGGENLRSAAKSPVLINIGRGDIMSEAEILNALENGWLSGAILDVFEEEPLPPSSPLWLHPKVIITPHSAGVSRATDVARSFAENHHLFLKEEPLINIIDWAKGY